MRIVIIGFRWEAKQIGPNQVELHVPDGPNGIINPKIIEDMRLSDAEIEKAEDAMLKAIAVL